jgi:ABC-type multidrug transport system fused ATPase/permease subunit
MRRLTPTDAALSKEQRVSGWRVIRRVAPYLWPDDKLWVKQRVVIALAMLLIAKIVAVGTPLLYARAVDALSDAGAPDLAVGAVGLTVAYGVARLMSNGFQQLRDAVFAKVGQCAHLRCKPLNTFTDYQCGIILVARPVV